MRAETRSPWGALSWLQRSGLILIAIVLVLLLAVWIATIVLRPHVPSPASITRAMRTQAALTGGAQVYATHCAYCHDKGFAPVLAGLNLPADAVKTFVRTGPANMPSFPPSQVSDADITAVAGYLSSLPAKAPAK